MTRFTSYVLLQLIIGMVFITLSLTCIIWLSQSLRFIEMIVNQGVSAATFIYLTILMLPSFLTHILPISLFCIVVFIYAKLISDRELVIMQAAGKSKLFLSKPGMILALIVLLSTYVLNLYILPESYRKFRELQWEIRNYSHIIFKEGTFTNIAGVTVYIRKRTSDGQLHGILAHDKRNPKKTETWMATKGALIESPSGSKFVMFDGNRQTVDPETKQLSILYFDQGILELKELDSNPDGSIIRHREARERTLSELLNASEIVDSSPENIGKFTVEAHKRLSSPLTTLGFTLIGLACLLNSGSSRNSQAKAVIGSGLIVACLLVSALGFQNFVAKNLNLVPLIYFHVLLPIFVAGYFVLRPERMRRTKTFDSKAFG